MRRRDHHRRATLPHPTPTRNRGKPPRTNERTRATGVGGCAEGGGRQAPGRAAVPRRSKIYSDLGGGGGGGGGGSRGAYPLPDTSAVLCTSEAITTPALPRVGLV